MKAYYYKRIAPEANEKTTKAPAEKDRADKISYTPIGQQVEAFIASGQVITSLKTMTAKVQEERKAKLEEVLKEPMTDFTRSIYEMDITEAYAAVKRFEKARRDREISKKEAEEKLKVINDHLAKIQAAKKNIE